MVVLPLVAVLFLLGCAEQGEIARDRTLVIAHPTGGLNQMVDYDGIHDVYELLPAKALLRPVREEPLCLESSRPDIE